MENALEARKKWKVADALQNLRSFVERSGSYGVREDFATVKGYIGLLELDLKNAKEKLDGDSKAEAAQPLHR